VPSYGGGHNWALCRAGTEGLGTKPAPIVGSVWRANHWVLLVHEHRLTLNLTLGLILQDCETFGPIPVRSCFAATYDSTWMTQARPWALARRRSPVHNSQSRVSASATYAAS
jgi:hypothetical protein